MRAISTLLAAVLLVAALSGAAAGPMASKQSGPPSVAATALIDVDRRDYPTIPQSFMGLSHEWPYVEEMSTQPRYMDMMNYLTSFGGGPLVVRIGGGSTDSQDFVPSPAVWQSLTNLHKGTGAKFIIGINLEDGSPELALKQMQAANAGLPQGSIQHFEIGNEPNFYNNRTSKSWQGDWRKVSGEAYIECCFWTDWENHAKYMACDGPSNCGKGANFAGPAWGHVNVRTSTINWFLNVNAKYVGLVTLHWYKATKETDNTPATLLEDGPIRKEMDNLKQLVGVAKKYGKPLRVAEMNTISNSGRDGVSNVFAATLWTLDGCFEVAAAGAVGVNFHQGAGQNLYSALIRWYNDDNSVKPVGIRPPFYALAMFQMATGPGVQMLPVTLSGASDGLKVWPLWSEAKKELRVVVINKRPSEGINATIAIPNLSGYGAATVTRLLASGDSPLDAKAGITLGGVYWDDNAQPAGTPKTETVQRAIVDRRSAWRVYMPPASAALLVIPRQ